MKLPTNFIKIGLEIKILQLFKFCVNTILQIACVGLFLRTYKIHLLNFMKEKNDISTKSSTMITHIQNFRGVESKEKKLLVTKNGQKHLWHIKITSK